MLLKPAIVQRLVGNNNQRQVMQIVRKHESSAFLPGILLPETQRAVYFGVRAFYIDLRRTFPTPEASEAHVNAWQQAIDSLYEGAGSSHTTTTAILPPVATPTLDLLASLDLSRLDKTHFDQVIAARRKDLQVTQYETLADLMHYAQATCGNLTQLVVRAGDDDDDASLPRNLEIAKHTGIVHGMTQQLRNALLILSQTRKLIIPKDLTQRYNLKSPRYVLSALSLGDASAQHALQNAVGTMVQKALEHLEIARNLHDSNSSTVFLNAVVAEDFLQRLQSHEYLLTDRRLRNTNILDEAKRVAKVLGAYTTGRI